MRIHFIILIICLGFVSCAINHIEYLRDRVTNHSTEYVSVFNKEMFPYNAVDANGFPFLDKNIKELYLPLIRIPAHIETSKGTIIVATEVQLKEGGLNTKSVCVARSKDRGNSWNYKFLYVGGNPNIIYDKQNESIFFMAGAKYYKSIDDGLTWTEREMPDIRRPQGWSQFFQSPTTGIQLSNGILVTVYELFDGSGKNIKRNANVLVFSRDYGETWEMSAITPDSILLNEATIAEYEKNQIMINSRGGTEIFWRDSNPGRRILIPAIKSSSDRTAWAVNNWGLDSSDKQLIEPICNASFISFKKNGHFESYFCNPYVSSGKRRNLTLQYSKDMHKWQTVTLMTEKEQEVYGYCSLCRINNHLTFVYEDMHNGIMFKDIEL